MCNRDGVACCWEGMQKVVQADAKYLLVHFKFELAHTMLWANASHHSTNLVNRAHIAALSLVPACNKHLVCMRAGRPLMAW